MTLTARHTLLIDAAATSVTAIALVAGRTLLYPYFGLETPFLIDITAVAFLAYAAIIAAAARRQEVSRAVVMTTAGANAAYVAASVVILVMFWSQLHPVGRALIVVVAIAVEGFATLQWAAARRHPAVEPA